MLIINSTGDEIFVYRFHPVGSDRPLENSRYRPQKVDLCLNSSILKITILVTIFHVFEGTFFYSNVIKHKKPLTE